jgi:hypothetical protein
MPYPYLPDDEVTFSDPGQPLANEYAGSPTSTNPRELFDFEFDLGAYASWTGVDGNLEFSVVAGTLPNNLTLNSSTGQISGTTVDMDTYIDWTGTPYEQPENFVLERDGSNFGSYGSAKAGSYTVEFTVRAHVDDAPDDEFYADLECSILAVNNYSSDRDQFIRDYTEQYGEGESGSKVLFRVNDVPVTAEEYLNYQKSLGNYPAL